MFAPKTQWLEPILIELRKGKEIKNDYPGFLHFQLFIINDLSQSTSKFRQQGYKDSGDFNNGFESITPRFMPIDSMDKFTYQAPKNRRLRVFIKGGGKVTLNMLALENYLAKYKRYSVDYTRYILFGFGAFLQILVLINKLNIY